MRTSLLLGFFVAMMASGIASAKAGMFDQDDGTYKTVHVTSSEQCSQLCKADLKCRGAVTYQPDVTKSEAICRLNNGFGLTLFFPQFRPNRLMSIALYPI